MLELENVDDTIVVSVKAEEPAVGVPPPVGPPGVGLCVNPTTHRFLSHLEAPQLFSAGESRASLLLSIGSSLPEYALECGCCAFERVPREGAFVALAGIGSLRLSPLLLRGSIGHSFDERIRVAFGLFGLAVIASLLSLLLPPCRGLVYLPLRPFLALALVFLSLSLLSFLEILSVLPVFTPLFIADLALFRTLTLLLLHLVIAEGLLLLG